jgi:hypothetical protein
MVVCCRWCLKAIHDDGYSWIHTDNFREWCRDPLRNPRRAEPLKTKRDSAVTQQQ